MIKKILQELWFWTMGKSVPEDLGFSCCFCNENITSADPDPSEIVIVANIDKPKEQQVDQIFWCHAQCLKGKIHDDIKPLFVLDAITKQKTR